VGVIELGLLGLGGGAVYTRPSVVAERKPG